MQQPSESGTGSRAVPGFEIEYEGLELAPVYVENIQGLRMGQGNAQVYLFTDYTIPPPTIQPTVTKTSVSDGQTTVGVKIDDPYGLQGGTVRIQRRIGANLILSEQSMRNLHSWITRFLQTPPVDREGFTPDPQEPREA